MSAVIGFVIGVLAVVFAFGFIIFIHELGHFITARAVDIRCPQFAIGFGPSLFSFRWRGTNFAVRAFPLGGYVMMNGEEPGDRTDDPWAEGVAYYLGDVSFPATPQTLLGELEKIPEEERAEMWTEVHDQVAYARCEEFPTLQSVEGNFHDRSVKARILVISGGVIMNFISTILILWCLGPAVGLGSFYQEWSPYVSRTVPEAPAASSGMEAGDLLLEVEGTPVATFLEAHYAIGRHAGTPVKMKIKQKKDGQVRDVELLPELLVGSELYQVSDDKLTVKKAGDETLVGKKVASPGRAELVELTRELSPEDTYEIQIEGEDTPRKFQLPGHFHGPRGLIGIQFGVNDIRFEESLSGVVASVKEGSPAAQAGLRVGDTLLGFDGLRFVSNSGLVYGSLAEDALASVQRVPEIEELEIIIYRNETAETLKVPFASAPYTMETLGIELRPLTTRDLAKAPADMIGQMLSMPFVILNAWLSKTHTGSEIVGSLQGPVGIMHMIYEFSDNGLAQFLYFVALLNAAIGAFNLLPFPALDGSRLVFLVIAGLRGKPLDPDKEARIHLAGLMVLLGFVVVVTFGDIKRLFSSEMFVL